MSPRLEAVHPVLMCRDVSESLAFYESLGFLEVFRDAVERPRYAAVRRDDVELHLQWHDAAQWAAGVDRPTLRLLVREVDALHAEFSARGLLTPGPGPVSPWAAPGDTPWGTREFHLRDPGGNGLQFYFPLE